MNTDNFAVIGGDYRTVFMANELAALGYSVKIFGFNDNLSFSEGVERGTSLSQTFLKAKYIILPLPCTVDDEAINTMLYDKKIYIRDFLQEVSSSHIILAGKVNKLFQALIERKGIAYYDYFEREEFTVANAIPTAEGAIEIALRETSITLHNSQCLILGYGRIAKVLAKMLHGMGAKVTIAARKHSDHTWADAFSHEVIYIHQLCEHMEKFDVIFNTVPKVILDHNTLQCIAKDCLIIDLASKPGGVDFETAQNLGLNVIWALSLPGKVAPVTAGVIIKDTILNIIQETEVK